MSLRYKLLLITLVALVFPLAGWQFVRQTENTLRQGQEQSLIASAQSMTLALVALVPQIASAGFDSPPLLAYSVTSELSLDGYADDWNNLAEHERRFSAAEKNGGGFQMSLAQSPRSLFVWIEVADSSPAPPVLPLSTASVERDHVELHTSNMGKLHLLCSGPGNVQALQETPNGLFQIDLPGACQFRPGGYQIELRLPLATTAMAVIQVDANVTALLNERTRIGMLDKTGQPAITRILLLGELRDRLAALTPAGTRARLYAKAGLPLARTEPLKATNAELAELSFRRWLRVTIYRGFLAPKLNDPALYADDSQISKIPEVQRALQGSASVGWRAVSKRGTMMVSAAVPLFVGEQLIGALQVERGSDALLIWSNGGLAGLLLGSLLTIIAAAGILFGYAGYLSFRIRRLRTAAESALMEDGSPSGVFVRSNANDDVGELSRSFAKLLEQVGDYTSYLKTLASKLSHELATPLAIVRSSLDNLEQETLPESARTYASRARAGADRLGSIIRAMSEASRLEHAIRSAEGEEFDLGQLVSAASAAYQTLVQNKKIECYVPKTSLQLFGAPELIHQALDKLVDNALSFAPAGGWVRIELRRGAAGLCELTVSNQGPPLPQKMQPRLFDSLVSVRDSAGTGPHLGLGLYIVKLVAELHNGNVAARNLDSADGVAFVVTLRELARR
jgi:two-component system, OmpR family, sensor histidine kinase ChvG